MSLPIAVCRQHLQFGIDSIISLDQEDTAETTLISPTRHRKQSHRKTNTHVNPLSVLQPTVKKSEKPPFVIHFLVPFIIQCLPSSDLVAVVLKPATSEPAKASEMAKEIYLSPLRTPGMTFFCIEGWPKSDWGEEMILVPSHVCLAWIKGLTHSWQEADQ